MSRLRLLLSKVFPSTRLAAIILSLIIVWSTAYMGVLYANDFKTKAELARQTTQKHQDSAPETASHWSPAAAHLHLNHSKLALLVEARPMPHLAPLILHMMSVVPLDWRFLFIGSQDSVFSLEQSYAIKQQQNSGKLALLQVPPLWHISSQEDVSRLMTDVRFYEQVLPGVEWILKYEHDSILCGNSETSLDDWLVWDWAGSPRTEDDRFSRNGGLSLRRISVIKRILGFQSRFKNSEPEDEWFGKRLWVLPGAKVASKLNGVLAMEDVFIERPMGFHVRGGGHELNDAIWGDAERRRRIFDYCPELSIIMDMKLERERCPEGLEETTTRPADISVHISVIGENGEEQEGAESSMIGIRPPPPPSLRLL